MSNVVLFNGGQVPAFVKAREGVPALAKSLAGSGDAGKRISIKGGVFRLIASGKEVAAIDERYLDVVIVAAAEKVNRQFFEKEYDSDTVSAPDCFSVDGNTSSPESKSRQCETCAKCPQNIAGSGKGESRACRFQQRLAVVLANDVEGDVMQLAVPAKSLFGKAEGDNRPLQDYARWLVAQNIDPGEVITRLKFDTSSESPKLFFKAMRWLTEDEHDTTTEKGKSPDALHAITLSVFKQDGGVAEPAALPGQRPGKAKPAVEQDEDEAPAPAPKKPAPVKKAKPAPAPAPEADEEEEEAPPPPPKKKAAPVEEGEEAAPVVRKAEKAPQAVVPAKKNLAAMIDDWDEE